VKDEHVWQLVQDSLPFNFNLLIAGLAFEVADYFTSREPPEPVVDRSLVFDLQG